MGDLISRQAAIDALDIGAELLRRVLDDTDVVGAERVKYAWGLDLLEACIADVKKLPSAQPERAEGEWINTNPEYKNGFYNNSYYCSECHDYYTTSPYEMKFCPNCGAKMEGEQQK